MLVATTVFIFTILIGMAFLGLLIYLLKRKGSGR